MTKRPNPISERLAEGLKPAGLDFTRIAAAAERLALAAERTTDAATKTLRVTTRSTAALETIAALLASVIGIAESECAAVADNYVTYPPVRYVRAGSGRKNFACDADAGK